MIGRVTVAIGLVVTACGNGGNSELLCNDEFFKAKYQEAIEAAARGEEEKSRLAADALRGVDCAVAEYLLADLYDYGTVIERDVEKAVELYRSASMRGFDDATRRLSHHLMRGSGVEQDVESGLELLEELARQGDADAQFDLGYVHLLGLYDVGKDCKTGVLWMSEAAKQGAPLAAAQLGKLYATGRCVEQDAKRAASWYEDAAEGDQAAAQAQLGMMLLEGKGVPRDPVLGLMWLLIAADHGGVALEEAAARLSEAELAEAERLAEEWRTEHPNHPAKDVPMW